MKPATRPQSGAFTNQQPKPMQEINLKLTVDEANVILEGLGSLPFAKVYALIAKIQAQAAQQLDRNNANESQPMNERPKQPTKANA